MNVLGLRIEREHQEGPSRLDQLREKLASWPKWTAIGLTIYLVGQWLWMMGEYNYLRRHFVWPTLAMIAILAIVIFRMENRARQAPAHHGGEHAEQPAQEATPADATQAQQAAPAAQPAAQPAANPTPSPAPQALG